MKSEAIVKLTDGAGRLLLPRLTLPRSFRARARGLLGRERLDPDEGMLFEHCRAIHMFGMRIPLDVIFLDRNGVILGTRPGLRPWRAAFCLGAAHTLETAIGNIERLGLTPGRQLLVCE